MLNAHFSLLLICLFILTNGYRIGMLNDPHVDLNYNPSSYKFISKVVEPT